MKISIVVAAADNGVIGKDNALIWRLPDDVRFFKNITMGKPIIMGRKTFDAIGKPLPGRLNIVVSRKSDLRIEGCVVVSSIQDAIRASGDASEACVIGGEEIYKLALPFTDVVYLTQVHASPSGDAYWSKLNPNEWREIAREEHAADERHAYAFTILTLERVRAS